MKSLKNNFIKSIVKVNNRRLQSKRHCKHSEFKGIQRNSESLESPFKGIDTHQFIVIQLQSNVKSLKENKQKTGLQKYIPLNLPKSPQAMSCM